MKTSAMVKPIPEPPPVMKATFPLSKKKENCITNYDFLYKISLHDHVTRGIQIDDNLHTYWVDLLSVRWQLTWLMVVNQTVFNRLVVPYP